MSCIFNWLAPHFVILWNTRRGDGWHVFKQQTSLEWRAKHLPLLWHESQWAGIQAPLASRRSRASASLQGQERSGPQAAPAHMRSSHAGADSSGRGGDCVHVCANVCVFIRQQGAAHTLLCSWSFIPSLTELQ